MRARQGQSGEREGGMWSGGLQCFLICLVIVHAFLGFVPMFFGDCSCFLGIFWSGGGYFRRIFLVLWFSKFFFRIFLYLG